MVEGKDRFQVGTFYDIFVILPIWQLPDWSPQLQVQLACAMVWSRPPKREKKPARSNLVGTVATTSKFWTPLIIETMMHKDEEVISL